MEPFIRVTGAVAALDRANVDTDQIIPKQFLKRIERSGSASSCSTTGGATSRLPARAARVPPRPDPGRGRQLRLGSSREHAPWALQDWGYRVIVAPSFADIFRSNCAKIGLLAVQLPEPDVRELIDRAPAVATVDLERQVVTLPSGREASFAIEPHVRENLLNGWDDVALTLRRDDEIATYERERERHGPSTVALGA
jgi:3-isopropylmalate/(R)-2-methylmalate dehydratase small subunit